MPAFVPLLRNRVAIRLPIDGFILALVLVLSVATIAPCHGLGAHIFKLLGTVAITLLFFLQGARLSREAVLHGATHWRLHIAVAVSTFVLFPLLGLGLAAAFPFLLPRPLWLGLLFVCALPSTVQSSIALTSIARGNVAAAICSATASNVSGIVLTPLIFGAMSNLHGSADLRAVAHVAGQLLLPFVAGHLLRPWIGLWAERNRRLLSITDRGSILIVVYTAFSAAVVHGVWQQIPPQALSVLVLLVAFMLCLALLAIHLASRTLGFDRPDEVALMFCGSQKSIVSGVPIANALMSGPAVGTLLLPIMLYHPMQLLLCTWIARRFAQQPAGVAATPPLRPTHDAMARR